MAILGFLHDVCFPSTLRKGEIYKHVDAEVVFLEFDFEEMMARVRDMSGKYFFVNVWELKER